MTIIKDMKPLSGCGANASDCCPSSLAAINCCSTAASSEISIDETSSTSSKRAKDCSSNRVNNNLMCKYDNIEGTFARCPEIDIEFEDIRYAVKKFSFSERKFVTKEILHGINGSFRSGELTAIMGPSGSGKSTLLNVMTGFRCSGVTGSVRVNGTTISTSSQKFRELSCYLHQDDMLRPQLTVGETMMLAAHLKLGFKISKKEKLRLVKHILSLLGLEHRYNVGAGKLSGGQKKRLAIALELISNPSVLYLDEPTTGLDSSSCSQCIALLKKLAALGHTIVCTIHQPSALIFEMFDKLYTVVEGHCIYQGPIKELIPFLADQNLLCPSYHNPADFLLEVAVGEHERDLDKLINAANKKYYEDSDLNQLNRVTRLITKMQVENVDLANCHLTATTNGRKLSKTFNTEVVSAQKSTFPSLDYAKPAMDELALEELKALKSNTPVDTSVDMTHGHVADHDVDVDDDDDVDSGQQLSKDDLTFDTEKFSKASFLMQYLLLLNRIFLCSRRNSFLLLARLSSHLAIGVIFGYLYIGVGNKANTVLGNYVYLYGSILLLVYTGKMAVVLTFPLEIGMLSREHFNRWYNLGPYFLSLLSFEVPFQCICTALYLGISIWMTDNEESDNFRVMYFMLFGILVTLSAQAWGFFVGATLPIKLAVFLGPILAVLFSVFGFCTRYIDITPLFRWMWHISYFRAGFHGAVNAIYGMNRSALPCPENLIYCHFRNPKVFLEFIMVTDVSVMDCVLLMVGVIGIMHLLTVIILWHKLNKR
ncbi:ATP-binding cassette sub-family G member 1 [Stomoxys calcitrans]|uniref:ABC transporter domain-containing protein n=1 Tax=Stomoxys calcitrans TaxID=35570 RepID=A0A1I8QEU0_STOCA|nr:ATP-binding cassette sub-family G member 1 [Stomoxys calcitrans]XP_013103682.1 ATP-binding cassette sub-family G member 1 [Stomoxys calcitrans]